MSPCLPRPRKRGTLHDLRLFSMPSRYSGAIRTWRSTPTLHHSNTPSLHHSITPRGRIRGRGRPRGRERSAILFSLPGIECIPETVSEKIQSQQSAPHRDGGEDQQPPIAFYRIDHLSGITQQETPAG